jgi:peroxiredoxin Q/BCP
MLDADTAAPDFCLPDQHGNKVCLADYRGRWVLLWWYPKAESPGCTVEGQVLRDNASAFEAAQCAIVGASFDTPEENLAFANAQGFEFRLLSDVDRKVGAAYQVVRQADHQYAIYPRSLDQPLRRPDDYVRSNASWSASPTNDRRRQLRASVVVLCSQGADGGRSVRTGRHRRDVR